MSSRSIDTERLDAGPAITLVVASVAFAVALFTRRTGNVWLGVALASLVSIGAAWLTNASPRVELGRGLARETALGAIAGAVMALATQLVAPVALQLVPGAEAEVDALYANLAHPPGPIAALPVLALAVVAEELVWRGVAMELLAERPWWVAVGAAALLYALPQIASGSWLLVALALACGLAWGAMRRWRGGLVAPITTHFVWNLAIFVLWPIRSQGY